MRSRTLRLVGDIMSDAERSVSERVESHANVAVTGDARDMCRTEAEIVHGLSNVLVSILLNAQLIDWKLPGYSRLRRNIHEIERSAQRAGTLLKQLADFGKVRDGSEQKT